MFNPAQNLATKIIKQTFYRNTSNKQCPPMPPSCESNSHKDGGYKLYKNLSLFVGLPVIAAVAAMTFVNKKKEKECPKRPPFVPYEYLRRRTKRFPWGEGDKSLFHNPLMNALPDGYEEDLECYSEVADGEEGEGEEAEEDSEE